MGQAVVMGAMLQCPFGMAPSNLVVLPTARVTVCGVPAATVADNVPFMNIPPFGMCQSLANPTVAAATAAALGALTPMPCVPVLPAPWTPVAPRTLVGGKPALATGSVCVCAWGGTIQVVSPGQMQTTVA